MLEVVGSSLSGSSESPTGGIGLALAEARKAMTSSQPNPRVGCVLADASGRVIGVGHTQEAGGAHAEVMALRDAQARGHSTQGATAYVTLEPCSHHGRTGPCCDALVAAGVGRVVASLEDPNPRVAGRGFDRLRAAGIAVETGPGATQSRELNIGFFSRMVRGRPWVRSKIAASFDGVTALPDGTSQWITSQPARADGHAWRARACAVLTGIGTVLRDDPQLDVRFHPAPRQPHAVVVDSRLELPTHTRLLQPGRRVWIYTAASLPARQSALEAMGATVIQLPGPDGKVDLPAMLQDLAVREVNEVHVEAGSRLNGSLLHSGLTDELLIYLAPMLLGRGQPMAMLGPLASLADGVSLTLLDTAPLGPDLRLLARVAGHDHF